jgi:hypothetical protein
MIRNPGFVHPLHVILCIEEEAGGCNEIGDVKDNLLQFWTANPKVVKAKQIIDPVPNKPVHLLLLRLLRQALQQRTHHLFLQRISIPQTHAHESLLRPAASKTLIHNLPIFVPDPHTERDIQA